MKTEPSLRSFLVIASSSLLAMSSANALTLTWDADTGTSGAQDGGGNWTVGGTTFWNGSTNVATTNNITTDIAQFGNGGTLASQATVNVSTQSINGLIFGATTTSGYNLTASSAGQILTLGASGITVNSGAQATNVGSANLGITLGAGQTWANASSSLLTINSNINLNGQTLTIGNNQNISGNITGAGTITVSGLTARRILSGTNSFTSNLLISSAGSSNVGILAVTSILDSTADSSLGKNNTITLGNGSASAGRLEYIGTATSSSNRTFIMGGTGNANAQIHNNGTGVLTFTATTLVSPSTGARTFILGGSNTGDNEIQGGINNTGTAVVSLSKTGAGKWILSGTNSYTGTTSVSGGELVLSGANSFSGTTTVSGGKLTLSGANTPGASATSINGGGELVLDYSGVGKNNAKIGTGALSLGSVGGTGGTITLTGGSHAQTVASTTLNTGGTFINRTSGTSTLNLGAITFAGGSGRGGTLSISADNVATTDKTNTNGIIGGSVVVGDNWAVNSTNGAAGAIVGLTTYTALPTSGSVSTTNYSVTGSLTLAGASPANSLKIIASADGQTLAMGSRDLNPTAINTAGGILFTANDDSFTYNITGTTGLLRVAAANNDTDFFVNNGTLNVTALTGSGTGMVVKAGTGTLILGGNNGSTGANWSGAASVQQGTLRLTHNDGAGTTGGGITVQNLATLELGNSVSIGAEALTITGNGSGTNTGALRNVASNTSSYAGTITIGANGARINSDAGGSLTLTAGITTAADRNVTFGGAGNTTVGTVAISGAGGLIKDGAGTTTLSFANTYTGATTINAGTLNISTGGDINSTSGINVAAGGTLRYNSATALTKAPTLNGTGTGDGQRAVLGGTGLINVGITLDNTGDVLSPGNSPGIQTYTPDQTWASFSYDWEVNNFTGTTAATDFDQISITGGLTLTGAAPNSYYLNVLSLTAGNVAGDAPNFSEINRSWTILTTDTGITGFDAASWNIEEAGFTNSETGTWAITNDGNNLMLSYTVAVPEAGTAGLLALGLLHLRRLRRRRA